MRHKVAHRKLNRTAEHRKALIKNMLNALIKHEQIETTLPKAKELKVAIDKIITLGKKNTLASKRILISKLQDQEMVKKITTTLIKRYEKRNGGYSRVIRSGYRYGDNAPKAKIELDEKDFNAKGQNSGQTQKKIENKEIEKEIVKK